MYAHTNEQYIWTIQYKTALQLDNTIQKNNTIFHRKTHVKAQFTQDILSKTDCSLEFLHNNKNFIFLKDELLARKCDIGDHVMIEYVLIELLL